jgi:methyl-accepting chemotaxis protein
MKRKHMTLQTQLTDSLQRTFANAGKVASLVSEIATASPEQAQGISQVSGEVALAPQVEVRRLRSRLEGLAAKLRQANVQLQRELLQRKRVEEALLVRSAELAEALDKVESLSGLPQICTE